MKKTKGIKFIENGTVIDCTYGEKSKCYQVVDALERQAKEILEIVKDNNKNNTCELIRKKFIK